MGENMTSSIKPEVHNIHESSPSPKDISIGSAVFAQLTYVPVYARRTDSHSCDMRSKGRHLCTARWLCGPTRRDTRRRKMVTVGRSSPEALVASGQDKAGDRL